MYLMLILICGLPCTGKSRLARHLSKEIGAAWLRSDKFREVMFPDTTNPHFDEQKLYPQAQGTAKNKAMVLAAETLLNQGTKVIVDSDLTNKKTRNYFYELAIRLNEDLFIIQCTAQDADVRKWMIARAEKQKESSYKIASYEIYRKKKELFEPFEKDVLQIDMRRPIESVLTQVKTYVGVK